MLRRGVLRPFFLEGFLGVTYSRGERAVPRLAREKRILQDIIGQGSNLSHRTETRHCSVCLGNCKELMGRVGRWSGAQNGGRCVLREKEALTGQNPPCAQKTIEGHLQLPEC